MPAVLSSSRSLSRKLPGPALAPRPAGRWRVSSRPPRRAGRPSRPLAFGLRGPCAVLLLLPLLGSSGCGDGSPECRVGADCASGICLSDGTCLVPDAGDGVLPPDDAPGADADVVEDDAAGHDAGPDDGTPDDGALVCSPNDDGRLERAEVPIRAGLRANFAVAADVTVDTAGAAQPDGSRRWDFSGALPGDHRSLEELRDPAGLWFADDFPTATYVAQLRDGEELLGVFEATADALLLLGVVSPEAGLYRTNLVYDPPVAVLRFPLAEGDTWSTEATVRGLSLGVMAWYSETYVSRVDAHGTLVTPYGAFPVLRVRVSLERVVGVVPTAYRSFLFVAECFGTVAAVHSEANETVVEFARAAEIRRLAR